MAHTKLDVFDASKQLVLACYQLTKEFPAEEKFAMTSQIRRAALSAHLNVAEGCSRKAFGERRRFYEIARGSVVEVDTAFDIAVELGYCTTESLLPLGERLIKTFKLVCGLIGADETHH